MTRLSRALAAAAIAAVTITACAPPGSDTGAPPAEQSAPITAPVTKEQVAALGQVELRILADAGEEQTLAKLIPAFQAAYPNVTVRADVRSYDDIVRTEVNTMAGDSPPDLAMGAQGYAVDGALVQAGLVRPLDDVAQAYGWTQRFGESALAELRWSDDGRTFGTGKLYGVSPVVSMVGVYYNRALLQRLGLGVPGTPAEFEAALEKAAGAGIQPIVLGNANRAPGLHAFGLVQDAQTPPQQVRDWIAGSPQASFDNPSTSRAATTLAEWARKGWIGSGVNGVSEDDAVARFAGGDGLFLLGGTWVMPGLEGAPGQQFGFFAMPPGDNGGVHAAPGSLGMGWHVSTRTKVLPAAVAFVAMLHAPEFTQTLVDLARVPVAPGDSRAPNPLSADAIAASARIVKEGGNTYSYDWATPTMMDAMGGAVQGLLAGTVAPTDFGRIVQKDWADFQARR